MNYIKIGIYYSEDDEGRKCFDVEGMQEEFDLRIEELQEKERQMEDELIRIVQEKIDKINREKK